MSTPRDIVIVGGGLGGAKTAEALRTHGYQGTITLLAGEPHLPYERPPLSKGYLAGDDGFEGAVVHPAEWYDEQAVDLRTGTRATAIDPAAHEVHLADGTILGYGALVLATGSVPRRLPLPGADSTNVHTLRTREDSDALKATFGEGKSLVIIGGGWIGLEVAAAARRSGTDVTVIESAELPLLGVLGPELARVFADLHRENGVDLRVETSVEAITTEGGRATGVRLTGGETLAADAIVVGVGAAPDISLAEAAGLAVEDGVLVDAALRTSDPDIFAVGDIANHDHPVLGRRIRVEHWATALNQPETVAAAVMDETDVRYAELPYFFSDQYDLGMEYIGSAPKDSYEQVVIRGDLSTREFAAFWLDGDHRILASMNVNVWDVVDEVKPLIAAGTPVDPDRLADPEVPYADLA